ncbi:MAG: cytochrome c3 family protein [Gammaproteobacteria bacterium]|jgi:c(7)-type cytochrome triheme protein|nr:hypothetical protein [Gammaproteobacteria bacterium]
MIISGVALIKRLTIIACVTAAIFAGCKAEYITDSRSAPYVVDSGVGIGKRWEDKSGPAPQLNAEGLAEDGIHDPDNEAMAVLQEPRDAMAAFPLDRSGAVDWVKALDLGVITPRADIDGNADMVVMDMDVTFKDTGEMPWVTFTHTAHTEWLGCDTCHADIFVPKIGANEVSMDSLFAGEYCGRCHGAVAFGLAVCERCHNTQQNSAKEKSSAVGPAPSSR